MELTDKEILGDNPVFKGTRVPVETLFLHLEKGIPLDEFLQDFPTVTKEQTIAVTALNFPKLLGVIQAGSFTLSFQLKNS